MAVGILSMNLFSRCNPQNQISYNSHFSLQFPSFSSARFSLFNSSSSTKGVDIYLKFPSLRLSAMGSRSGYREPMLAENSGQARNHLIVLVHGLGGSPTDWTYTQAELQRRLGSKFLIYASSVNAFRKTYDGIDVAGSRLADEVIEIRQREPSLQTISFLSHSLGGLLARYAIMVLYSNGHSLVKAHGESKPSSGRPCIASLEPVNFITLATPHIGVRGRNQLPFLFGVPLLERVAPPVAPLLIQRTGRQLFLTDGKPQKPPLLLRMASDSESSKFISALAAFKCRILYANVSYDHMVGWRTSSIRRESELVEPPRRFLEGYKHVVDVQHCPAILCEGPSFPVEAAKAKEAAQLSPSFENTLEYHDMMEEEMIRGLHRVSWLKVDVSFHSVLWPFLAHNNINVKQEWLHSAGAGVIAHVADSIKQQESGMFPISNL